MRIRVALTCLCALAGMLTGIADLAAQSTAPSGTAPPDPTNLALVGNRFPPLKWADMSEQQKTMMRHVLDGPRTAPNGPFNVMLRSPVMGDFAQELGAQVRFNSSLPAPLREMAILMTARYWTAHYEWNAHKTAALRAGLTPEIVTAIAAGQMPKGMQANEAALHRFCSELLYETRVSNDTFAAAKAAFGEQGVAEIIFTLGYYSTVSMLLNVDEYPLPDGVQVELKPLSR